MSRSYFNDGDGRRYLKSCVVEIPGLPVRHFPILPDTTELKFEHAGSHKRCTITWKQVPTEPGFAMTVHKAQGQALGRVIIDLAGCVGTEQPYVTVSRVTSLQGLIMVFRNFDTGKIAKRRSEELRKEFIRLTALRRQTITKYEDEREVAQARERLVEKRNATGAKSAKRKAAGKGKGVAAKRALT